MRAAPAPSGWHDRAFSRAGGWWFVLPAFAGALLYGLQGVPRILAGHLSGASLHTYWTDPWWIAGDATYVGILAVAMGTRRSRIRADWSIFVALWAALVFVCVGSVGAAVQYSYGRAGTAFFYTLLVSFAVHWTFWIALALGLLCLGVAAHQRTIRERRAKDFKASLRRQSGQSHVGR